MPDAEVTFHRPPGDQDDPAAGGILIDTPESRAALEQVAIPRCREWRETNPEDGPGHPDGPEQAIAPYCPSAYCPRCAGLRALDGADPITPNQWLETE